MNFLVKSFLEKATESTKQGYKNKTEIAVTMNAKINDPPKNRSNFQRLSSHLIKKEEKEN